jgi:hypothetical protein
MVTHVCNPRYLRGRVQEDQSLRPVWLRGAVSEIPISTTTKKSRCGNTQLSSHSGGSTSRRTMAQVRLGKNIILYLKNK